MRRKGRFSRPLNGLDHPLTSDADVNARIKSATSIFGALRDSVFSNKSVDLEVKNISYVVLVLSILHCGSGSLLLRTDQFQRLRLFYKCACRSMCISPLLTPSATTLKAKEV
jgi:hypothetical protein